MQLYYLPKIGYALALLGGLIISFDIPVIKLAQGDAWIFVIARGLGLAIVLGFILTFARKLTNTPPNPLKDRDFLEVGLLYGLSSFLFTVSVFLTSTANLVFILAFNPMIAAFFAWWMIGEKPKLVTWLAIAATMVGVAIIVGDGLQAKTGYGDFVALATALVLGFSIVRARKSGKDMSLSGAVGGVVSASFALPFALTYSTMPQVPEWLLFNGFVMAPIAAFALSLAPRFIPAPQVAMFFLLETVLAPIWVWIIFGEVPTSQVLIGGVIILTAIGANGAYQLSLSSKSKRKLAGQTGG